ncbi:hypothetical protein M885DRAFT_565029 [Pelagophyceae sp. CCMP2097]|nr:hypothetical protein M885DRAFT_565029 [Pelagophyceae sp. CCMP2097]
MRRPGGEARDESLNAAPQAHPLDAALLSLASLFLCAATFAVFNLAAAFVRAAARRFACAVRERCFLGLCDFVVIAGTIFLYKNDARALKRAQNDARIRDRRNTAAAADGDFQRADIRSAETGPAAPPGEAHGEAQNDTAHVNSTPPTTPVDGVDTTAPRTRPANTRALDSPPIAIALPPIAIALPGAESPPRAARSGRSNSPRCVTRFDDDVAADVTFSVADSDADTFKGADGDIFKARLAQTTESQTTDEAHAAGHAPPTSPLKENAPRSRPRPTYVTAPPQPLRDGADHRRARRCVSPSPPISTRPASREGRSEAAQCDEAALAALLVRLEGSFSSAARSTSGLAAHTSGLADARPSFPTDPRFRGTYDTYYQLL